MPFTATTGPKGGVLVTAEEVDPSKGPFFCRFPDCLRPMGVKTSTKGRKFFAHNPGEAEARCEGTQESYEHQRMKAQCRELFMNWGIACEEEFRNEGGYRRFDLLVANLFAVECQVSTIGGREWIERIEGDFSRGYFTWWIWHAGVFGLNLGMGDKLVGKRVKIRMEAIKKNRRMGDGWLFVMDDERRMARIRFSEVVRGWGVVEKVELVDAQAQEPPTLRKVARLTLTGGAHSPRVQLNLVVPLPDYEVSEKWGWVQGAHGKVPQLIKGNVGEGAGYLQEQQSVLNRR